MSDGDYTDYVPTADVPEAEDPAPSTSAEPQEAVLDLSGDGTPDSLISILSNGVTRLTADLDGDAVADIFLQDADSDGTPEARVVRQGDTYQISLDRDGSGNYDSAETISMTRAELTQVAPAIVEQLDLSFSQTDVPAQEPSAQTPPMPPGLEPSTDTPPVPPGVDPKSGQTPFAVPPGVYPNDGGQPPVPPGVDPNSGQDPTAMTPGLTPSTDQPPVPPGINPNSGQTPFQTPPGVYPNDGGQPPVPPGIDPNSGQTPFQVPPDVYPNDGGYPDDVSPQVEPTPDPRADDGADIGDPVEWSEHWFFQAEDGHCVPASVTQIVAEYKGVAIQDESMLVNYALENGFFASDDPNVPDNNEGMTAPDAARLLNDAGVPAQYAEGGTVADLSQALDQGRGIMLFVDSGEYGETGETADADQEADHCVVVSGIDEANGVVYLSDPGRPDGDALQVPIDVFNDAWADSGYGMVVCESPSPHAGDAGAPDSGAARSSIATTVGWATRNPWIMLPVTIRDR